MADYLLTGDFMEELGSGAPSAESTDTGVAGFIGAAQRGPVAGKPVAVHDFAEFKGIYGGYPAAAEYQEFRYLAYAVEHFFINGGERAFINRVAPRDAVCAAAALPAGEPVLKLQAKNPGAWGNDIRIVISPSGKAETQIYEVLPSAEGMAYVVKNGTGFYPGDIVAFTDGTRIVYNRVVKNQGNVMTFEQNFDGDVADKRLIPEKTLTTCELDLEIWYEDLAESYHHLSFNSQSENYIEKRLAQSGLITLVSAISDSDSGDIRSPFFRLADGNVPVISAGFRGGSDGRLSAMTAADFIGRDGRPEKRTGLKAFRDFEAVSVMAVPGVTDSKVQQALIAHCEESADCFAVLDLPPEMNAVEALVGHSSRYQTTYAAFYHPWLTVFAPLDKQELAIPPSGSIAGIYARTDRMKGVHKAPVNEVVRACVGLTAEFTAAKQEHLSAAGVNLIEAFPGQGIRVMGAKTAGCDDVWQEVNMRRFFIFIEKSVKMSTSWAEFEPNDEFLWIRVQHTVQVFLANLWRNGSLAGTSPGEAFFVNVGRSTMSQDDIDSGRMVCVIGVAPVRPADFTLLRITQKTGSAKS